MVFTPLHRELDVLAMMPLDQHLLMETIRVGVNQQPDLIFSETPHTIAHALAQDLCALANRGGGWICYGIHAPDGVAEKLMPSPPIDNIDHTVNQVAHKLITPPISNITVHHIPINPTGDVCYAIEVPYSNHAPHTLPDGTAPIRRGTTCDYLTTEEQHQLRADIRTFPTRRSHTITTFIDEYQQLGTTYGGATFILAAAPTHLLRPELTTHDIERALYDIYTTDYLAEGYDQNLGIFHFSYDPTTITNTTLRYEAETDTFQRTCGPCEITTTGFIRMAFQLGGGNPHNNADNTSMPLSANPAHVSPVELELTLLETFVVVAALQEHCFNSDYDLWVGLARRHKDEPVVIRRMTIHESGNRYLGDFLPAEASDPITHPRLITGHLPLDSTVDEKRTVLNHMCLDLMGQSGSTTLRLIREAPDNPQGSASTSG